MSFQKGDRTFREPLNPITAFFMVAFHIGAIAAIFFFSWKAIAVAAVLWIVSCSFGIGMGYHRLLTHRGYKTPKWMEYFLTTCGTLALEGGPIYWVAVHRIHHQLTDVEGDPHSPLEGGFWAHIGWVLTGKTIHNDNSTLLPYVPDLRKDRFHMWISKWHWVPLTVLGLALLAIGGWPYLLWGTFVRTTVGLHFTFLVNSATHMWGSQRFLTGDKSTNSFWVAIVSFGEGWHNNHHAHPQSARHGLTWWEIDWNWYCISFLKMVGLAWDVKLPRFITQKPEPAMATAAAAAVTSEVPAEEELAIASGD